MGSVPTGLRMISVGMAHPTLKHGANNHCAYGAELVEACAALMARATGCSGMERCCTGPFEGPPIIKLPE